MADLLNSSNNGYQASNDSTTNAAANDDSQFGNNFKTPLSRKTVRHNVPKNKVTFYTELMQFHEKIG